MINNPKVSVIIPVYNVGNYLRECLDSVINQTLEDIEIICINDGSKDNCPQIINEYAKKDNRIIAIHKQNGGYGSAMNVGLDRATGEYIGIVEPDDYIDSEMYEDLYKIAKEFDSDIVKSCFYDNLQAKEEQRILKTKWDDEKLPQNRSFKITECGLFLQYHPSIWSCIYKKEFLDKHNIRFVEAPGAGWTDNPFQVQTMCLAERINYTPNAYYYWRRLNKDESDDLKDITIPFKRTEEIHKWLEENNITDAEILSNLYVREMAYISIVLGKQDLDLKNIEDAINLTTKLLNSFDKDLFHSAKNIKKKNKKAFQMILKNPLNFRKKILFQRFKKNLINIRWNKKERIVMLFGKIILKGEK